MTDLDVDKLTSLQESKLPGHFGDRAHPNYCKLAKDLYRFYRIIIYRIGHLWNHLQQPET